MDARNPVVRSWIRSAEVRGECHYENWNTTTKTGINEVVQPWKWTLLGSVWCISNKIWTHNILSLSAQADNV